MSVLQAPCRQVKVLQNVRILSNLAFHFVLSGLFDKNPPAPVAAEIKLLPVMIMNQRQFFVKLNSADRIYRHGFSTVKFYLYIQYAVWIPSVCLELHAVI